MESLQGQFILAGGNLTGSEFQRTVILICQHDTAGAFGVVLNRPTAHLVGEALPVAVPAEWSDLPLRWGGPVQPQGLTCLAHAPGFAGPVSEADVLPGLHLTHALEELAEQATRVEQVAFFAGYAGWTAGQLENEMRQRAWLTHPASLDLVFHPGPVDLWRVILKRKGPRYRLLAALPDDVSRN